MQHEEGIKDRRVQKTKSLLHEALGSLIREKPYDAIVVQDILDRANVGLSEDATLAVESYCSAAAIQ